MPFFGFRGDRWLLAGEKSVEQPPEETLAIDEEHTHAVVHAMYDNRKLVLMFSILAFMLVFLFSFDSVDSGHSYLRGPLPA